MQKIVSASVVALFALAVLGAEPALAQHAQANHVPVCAAKTITIDKASASEYIDSLNITPLANGYCTDRDGDDLTVASVAAPGKPAAGNAIIVPYPKSPGQNVTVAYTVSDGKGGQATATITLVRQ